MRALIALIVIIYLVGVGVVLAPTVRSRWSTDTASDLAANVAQALPAALAWPAGVYRVRRKFRARQCVFDGRVGRAAERGARGGGRDHDGVGDGGAIPASRPMGSPREPPQRRFAGLNSRISGPKASFCGSVRLS